MSFKSQLLILAQKLSKGGISCELIEFDECILKLEWHTELLDKKDSLLYEQEEDDILSLMNPMITMHAWIRDSPSFEVPQFFFQPYANGSDPLTKMEQIFELLEGSSQYLAYDALAIGDCPGTVGIAWYIHPCRTRDYFEMLQIDKEDPKYLSLWLLYIHQVLSPLTQPIIKAVDDAEKS
ncbi:Ubiquitin-like-conjugating enzyme ATG10 [Schizosaccharomyces pombe]